MREMYCVYHDTETVPVGLCATVAPTVQRPEQGGGKKLKTFECSKSVQLNKHNPTNRTRVNSSVSANHRETDV